MSARTRIVGPAALLDALAKGEPLRLVMVREGSLSVATSEALESARAAGVPVREAGAREIERLAPSPDAAACEVLALAGPEPAVDLDTLMARSGAVWLLAGVAYPGNAGFAIRTAEVSGAAGIVVDAAFDHDGRRQALRRSIRADRFFPVLFSSTALALGAARRARRRIVGIEDGGTRAPWEADLTGPVVFTVGGEARGIPADALESCDEVLRIPMAGFIPAYNLQAAVAIVAGERLRQIEAGREAAASRLD